MRKAILILLLGWLLIIAVGLYAQAGPFLTCDPARDVTHYEVTIDGQAETVPAHDIGDGTVKLWYDLSGLGTGPHSVSVKAINIWGMSEASTMDFTKALPDAPVNVHIEGS